MTSPDPRPFLDPDRLMGIAIGRRVRPASARRSDPILAGWLGLMVMALLLSGFLAFGMLMGMGDTPGGFSPKTGRFVLAVLSAPVAFGLSLIGATSAMADRSRRCLAFAYAPALLWLVFAAYVALVNSGGDFFRAPEP